MDANRYYLRIDNLNTKDEKRFLASPTLITKADESTGIVDAIVSVMGNVDLQDDIIHQGSFVKTIQERGLANIRVLDNHNFFSVEDAIAVPLDIHEVNRGSIPKEVLEKYPETTGGLFTSSQFMLDDPKSSAVFRRLKVGAVNQYSIGFQIVKQDWNEQEIPQGSGSFREIRNIREIRLFEYSPVLFAANPATVTVGVKNAAFALPITVSLDIVKRAVTAKSCVNCQFFGKIAEGVGYCKRHDGTTKSSLICDEYNPTGEMIETYGKRFASLIENNLKSIFETWDNLNSDMTANIPTMVTAITQMLPTDIVDKPYIDNPEPPTDKSQPQVTSTEADSPALSKTERQALIVQIKQRELERKLKTGVQ